MPAPKGNQFWRMRESWNPKEWETPEQLESDIQEYFNLCDEHKIEVYNKKTKSIEEIKNPIPYTIEGLCEVLGVGRQTLLNYQKEKGYEVFFDTIKKAKQKIAKNKIERGLMGASNPVLTIFDLKNNHGYVDKTESSTDNKVSIDIPIINWVEKK